MVLKVFTEGFNGFGGLEVLSEGFHGFDGCN